MASERCPPCPEPDNCYCDGAVRLQGEIEGRPLDGIVQGHVLDVLGKLPADSVSCVVTSPPYWSLRKYSAPDVIWGGSPDCPHTLEAAPAPKRDRQHLKELGERDGSSGGAKHSTGEQYDGVAGGYTGSRRWQHSGVSRQETPDAWVQETKDHDTGKDGKGSRSWTNQTELNQRENEALTTATCSRCGAWRGQFGLEPNVELYVEHTLDVLRAIRRVLRPDGIVFWNIADGYAGGHIAQADKRWQHGGSDLPSYTLGGSGLKPKDLVLMPQRIALAAQADGWWIRSMIIWSKPNSMPESVTDRPSNAHEYVLMLTRSKTYWYDQEAVREAAEYGRRSSFRSPRYQSNHAQDNSDMDYPTETNAGGDASGRNMRDVWVFPTAQTPEAHFATFPEELPRRCIEASCPREICVACGKPRVRLVERQGLEEHPARANRRVRNKADYDGQDYERRESTLGLVADDVTVGWSDCGCGAAFEPGIVLDPFAGIGTTGIVTNRLSRRFIGIELSEEYAEMARKKLSLWWRKATLTESEAPSEQVAMELP